jgi:hypothetical protein
MGIATIGMLDYSPFNAVSSPFSLCSPKGIFTIYHPLNKVINLTTRNGYKMVSNNFEYGFHKVYNCIDNLKPYTNYTPTIHQVYTKYTPSIHQVYTKYTIN